MNIISSANPVIEIRGICQTIPLDRYNRIKRQEGLLTPPTISRSIHPFTESALRIQCTPPQKFLKRLSVYTNRPLTDANRFQFTVIDQCPHSRRRDRQPIGDLIDRHELVLRLMALRLDVILAGFALHDIIILSA